MDEAVGWRGFAVPKTRRGSARDEKVGEILDAAEERLRAGGIRGLSIAGLAREIGIAQNTIYWYFPSKDELIVAALGRMLQKLHAAKPKGDVGVVEKIVWFTDQLELLYRLKAGLNDQAGGSQVIADFIAQMNQMLRGMLGNALRPYVEEAELSLAIEMFASTVEGAYLRGLAPEERRSLFTFTLERLTSPGR